MSDWSIFLIVIGSIVCLSVIFYVLQPWIIVFHDLVDESAETWKMDCSRKRKLKVTQRQGEPGEV